ncbi:MAG: putative protein of unknown function, zinc metallopeptidase [Marmoricola sp.]|nr:putative protein of unknown function, zinc metallopeptidase [Marmoricola sp.]
MRFNPRATIDQSQTEHRSGGGGLGGGGGKLTLGGVVVLGVVFLVNQFTGVDISALVPDGGDGGSSTEASTCRTGEDASTSDQCAIDLLTNSVQNFWTGALPDQGGPAYTTIRTITFQGATDSGCGTASSATGPFYCPSDQSVYIDTNFMADMLEGDLGAKGGTFALAYVVAHEYGHHVEDLIGRLPSDNRTGADSDSVKTELMADCLGGMWARSAQDTEDEQGNKIITDLTQDDIARAVDAATAVGDDRIQQQSGGDVDPDAWTHGSSAQRVKWFNTGLTKGSLRACDTFQAGSL